MRRWALLAIGALIFISGCTTPPHLKTADSSEAPPWHGRLAVQIASDAAQSAPQSFSAAFELSGNATAGELILYAPLGNIAAALSWSPQAAVMRARGEVTQYESLDALIQQALGTAVPVAALFAWLRGDPVMAAGWSADLSQKAAGRITARRTEPLPQAELRLVLEP